MSILINGNQGFIEFWLNIYLKEIPNSRIFGIDNRSYLGERLIDFKENSNTKVEEQFFECKEAVIESINWYKKMDLEKSMPWDFTLNITRKFIANLD